MSEETKKSITIFKTPSWWILGSAFLIMLAAKCFGFMPDLPWWAVTCPLWGPFALCGAFFLAFYAIAAIAFFVVILIAMISVTIESIVEAIEMLFRKRSDRKENDDDYRLHG